MSRERNLHPLKENWLQALGRHPSGWGQASRYDINLEAMLVPVSWMGTKWAGSVTGPHVQKFVSEVLPLGYKLARKVVSCWISETIA